MDSWAAGCISHCLLTGQVPFTSRYISGTYFIDFPFLLVLPVLVFALPLPSSAAMVPRPETWLQPLSTELSHVVPSGGRSPSKVGYSLPVMGGVLLVESSASRADAS